MEKNNKRVLIVHGYTATPDLHWFPWIKKELEKDRVWVSVPAMPDSEEPKLDAWVEALDREMPQVDENSHFIGHSLGCISVLQYLAQKHPGKKVGSLVMVSGFGETVSSLPELAEFTEPRLSLAFAKELAASRLVITAQDDEVVPWEYSRAMADEMDAELICLKTGGHFSDWEGWEEFPILLERMKENLK